MKTWIVLAMLLMSSSVLAQCPDEGVTEGPPSLTITKLTNVGKTPDNYSIFVEYRYRIDRDMQAELWYYRTEFVWLEPKEIWTCSDTRVDCSPSRNGKGHASDFATPYQSHTRTDVTLRLVVPVE